MVDLCKDLNVMFVGEVNVGVFEFEVMVGGVGLSFGCGGMLMKIFVVKCVVYSGVNIVIVSGWEVDVFVCLVVGEVIGM